MSSGPSLGALVIVDEPVAGIADQVAATWDPEDEVAAGERLRASLAADGNSLPADRGLPDLARRIVARLRGQRLVEDLGEVDGTFEMFGLHVPPDGRAALDLCRNAASERHVSVTAMGLGFGGGRKLTLAIDEDIPERGVCMCVFQHVVMRVRRFAAQEPAESLVMTDIVAWGRREMAALPDCPYCGASGDDLNPFEFDEDTVNALDLRAFDTAVTRETEITLEGPRKADVGVDLALPAAASSGPASTSNSGPPLLYRVVHVPGRPVVPPVPAAGRVRDSAVLGDPVKWPYFADVIGTVPGGWDRGPAQRIAMIAAAGGPLERRVWRLWLEAQWATKAGAHQLAHHALDIAERMAKEMVCSPIWGLESHGLRAKLPGRR